MIIRTTGASAWLRGTTLAARPELAGMVVQDRLRPFDYFGTITGVLQERIVRSNVDDTLAFYYRIKELSAGSVRAFIAIRSWPAALTAVDMDYRIDGLGEVGPNGASGDTPPGGVAPTVMRFRFDAIVPAPAVTPTALSRFMFIKMIPGPGYPVVTEYEERGEIIIQDRDWSMHFPNSFRPVIR